ncbi:contractile injection system protein, VgrG/Pvc8 family [Paenibacillus sp. Leaf72]|uniref:contractile injection system protein, VgrG/Pvc8 family n=1 Tax=Paenibacillus sp. Leaf72 TaxID=1736234 RepID=UPI0006FAF7B1|nr:contractile injection system protein, VgrG/Pvc8 family [Paenibacillus sp. Leaf72]KQO06238.1 hypothetical protein ASF12_32590 [Paenibacillus sp. Leaf72]
MQALKMQQKKAAGGPAAPARLSIKHEGEAFPLENMTLTMEKHPNEHTKVRLRGIASEETVLKLMRSASMNADIELFYENSESNRKIFHGIIIHMDAEAQGIEAGAVHYLTIEALSHTYLMDIVTKQRSFQNMNMTYEQLIKEVLEDYPKSDFLHYGTAGDTLNGITLQYQETDWSFIKRMASRLYIPLIAHSTFNSPKFVLGVEENTAIYRLESANEKVFKNVEAFRSHANNHLASVQESDYLVYEITITGEHAKWLELGEPVLYRERTHYVLSVVTTVKNHLLSHTYQLSRLNGFFTPPKFNEAIAGLTLQGSVIKVSRNVLKVHLDIDPSQSENSAYWLKYSTFYATWYCMPETGDRVNVHFPTKDESDALVINSIKHSSSGGASRVQSTAGTGNASSATSISAVSATQAAPSIQAASTGGASAASKPNFEFSSLAEDNKVKMIVTEGGKMIILDDNSSSVSIVCNDSTFIRITDGSGISISTDMDITFESGADISFTAEEMIYMKATDKIALQCGESQMEITPEEIKIKSTDIKLNT